MSSPWKRQWWLLLTLPIAFAAGLLVNYESGVAPARRTVALRWGDGSYGPAFYGAHVFVDEVASRHDELRVRAMVYIARPSRFIAYVHDCEEIGRAKDWPDAVARFGTVRWSPDGLRIGAGGEGDYFLPRQELENHR